jgi:hypothetical protein
MRRLAAVENRRRCGLEESVGRDKALVGITAIARLSLSPLIIRSHLAMCRSSLARSPKTHSATQHIYQNI